eukprot:3856537-Pleurochrysis_carterae.AAC.1
MKAVEAQRPTRRRVRTAAAATAEKMAVRRAVAMAAVATAVEEKEEAETKVVETEVVQTEVEAMAAVEMDVAVRVAEKEVVTVEMGLEVVMAAVATMAGAAEAAPMVVVATVGGWALARRTES